MSPGYIIRRLLQSGYAAWTIVNTAPVAPTVQLSLACLRNRSTGDMGKKRRKPAVILSSEKCKTGGKQEDHRSRLPSVQRALHRSESKRGRVGKGERKNRPDSQIRTDVFYRSIETIRVCEPGGQLADDSTAGEHLRRAGRPYAIWWPLAVFPLSSCRVR